MEKSGWQLKEGQYRKTFLNEDELWKLFNNFLSTKSVKNTGYKFIFMRSLLLNLEQFDTNRSINYIKLFETFTQTYWDLYIKEQKRQSRETQISIAEKIFNEYCTEELRLKEFNSLSISIQGELIKKINVACQTNVIGAVYADFNKSIYSFSNSESILILNPIFFEFMLKYKKILLKLNYLEWIKYMEKVNDTININRLDYLSY